MKRKRILVFGYFGHVTNQLDGQTVKTRSIHRLLKDKADADVTYADTQEFHSSPKAIAKFLWDLCRCHTLVDIPCVNNLFILTPPLYWLSKILRFKIVHVAVGGWHMKGFPKHPRVARLLGKVEYNLYENRLLCDQIAQTYGYGNIGVIPNFRERAVGRTEIPPVKPLKLVFMARAEIKKGLDTLAALAKWVEDEGLTDRVALTVYGPPSTDVDREFLAQKLVAAHPWVKYGGKLEPDQIVPSLQKHHVLMFPTHYFTEGFPGTILDAYRASLPVIATRWKYANEFVKEGKTGFIVDFDNPLPEITATIERLLDSPDQLAPLSEAAYQESLRYTPEAAWEVLAPHL